MAFKRVPRLIVVVFTLNTVLAPIQYILFLTFQGKETNFRGHRLTQLRYRKKKRPKESANTSCEKT